MRLHSAGRVRLLIFFGSFVIFFISPVTVLLDSQFALLTTESLLKNRTPALDRYQIPGLDPSVLPSHRGLARPGMFYQLVRIGGRVMYLYPHGGCFLTIPFVAVLDALGVCTVKNGVTYDFISEVLQEKLVASFLMALVAAVFFEIGAAAKLPATWSAALAVAGAWGTPIWSSASRTLWSQTWEVLLYSLTVLLLLRADERRSRPILLATLMGWTYFVRPTAAVAIAAVTLYIWWFHRRDAAAYLIALAAWMLTFIVYWQMVFGAPLPDYYCQGNLLSLTRLGQSLPAILLSPSRGLLVFVPTIAIVVYLVARYWRAIDRGLALLALGIICGNLLAVASFPNWWGGWSYGPRLLTGTIPWFVLLAAVGGRALNADVHRGANVTRIALGLMLLAIAINGWGAVSWPATFWSKEMRINSHPERVWDWRHPQFLAGL
jgi:hypothetical protein